MSEAAKQEKARRVWRLNKLEDVPVMDAMDQVGISKDTYYRIKRDREDEWEDEVLTVDRIQEELEELEEEIEELESKYSQVEERMQEARSLIYDAEEAADNLEELPSLERRVDDLEDDVERLVAEADIESDRVGRGVSELNRALEKLEQLDLEERLTELERKAGNNEGAIESLERDVRELKSDDGGWL